MEINAKESEYTRVSTYTNVSLIDREYSRIDNKKPSIIGSLRSQTAIFRFCLVTAKKGSGGSP